MNKQYIFIFFLILSNLSLAQQWQNVGNSGFSPGIANYTSIAIDGNGVPYVVFQDNANSNKATVKKYASSVWSNVGVPGFSAGQADYTQIAIDGTGTPYVIYEDYSNSHKATVMKFDGLSWVKVGSDGFPFGGQGCFSIAIDLNGTPYVAYTDNTNFGKATVKKYSGSSWVNVGNPGFSAGYADFTKIAIDGDGAPYVIYADAETYGAHATVMKFNGSNWVNVGSAGFSAGSFDNPSIAIDGNGIPYVAYEDYSEISISEATKATVMKYNGTSWVTVGTAGFSPDGAASLSIAINRNGTPYVAFMDFANSNKATVMKYNGTSWITAGSPGFSAGLALYTTIAIDGNGTSYVVYKDFQNSQKATVMKYLEHPLIQISLVLKIFLEGPYTSNSMNTTLNSNIPLVQPYSVNPWNYNGTEAVASGFFSVHPDIVDWILVELRTGTDASTNAATRACFLKADGSIVDLDGTSSVDFIGLDPAITECYVVIHHRNHLSVMSSTPVQLN